MPTSQRWGTVEAIMRVGGEAIEGVSATVDASILRPDGLTERQFSLHASTEFQQTVRMERSD